MSSKPWTRSKARTFQSKLERRRVLIMSEDTKSSCFYFAGFKLNPERIELQIVGTGFNTDSLVGATIEFRKKQEKTGVRYSEVWCVFDRDSFQQENYHRAFELAYANNIKPAWSNEAFELWYLLHFSYIDTGLKRASYAKRLQDHGLVYEKNDEGIYLKLEHKQADAIKHAKRLTKHWNESGVRFPERENPSTKLHELVEFLLDLQSLDENPSASTDDNHKPAATALKVKG